MFTGTGTSCAGGAAGFPVVQRYFTLQALDPAQPAVPGFTAAHRTEFPSQEFREGTALRTTKTKRADGRYLVGTEAYDPAQPNQGYARQGNRKNRAADSLTLDVSENGHIAIEHSAGQPRAFFADNPTVTASNQTLRSLASPIHLVTGGGSVDVPQDPNPAHLNATPRTLDKVTADATIPADHPSEKAGQALLSAVQNSECNNVVKLVLGAAEGSRKAVLGTAAAANETEVPGGQAAEPVYELADFVSSNPNSGNVANAAAAAQGRVGYDNEPAAATAYQGLAARPNAALGINEKALPEVGEGYAIRSLGANMRRPALTYSTTKGSDEYLQAIRDLRAANGSVDTILRNIALAQDEATRAFQLKTFWGEHYAGVVAKDGGDTVTHENYNRAPQVKWPINEAFNDLYAKVAEFRAYVRGLTGVLTAKNMGKQIQMIQGFEAQIRLDGTVLSNKQQKRVDAALKTVGGRIDEELGKDMIYFQMYGQAAGQSFHEKFTQSQGLMSATANAMTLRVRGDLVDHKTKSLVKANDLIGPLIHALAAPSGRAHLSAALQNMRDSFTPVAGDVLQELNAATTVRKVEKAMMKLAQAKTGVLGALWQEVLHVHPTAAAPPSVNIANHIQGLWSNIHIGKDPRGRAARKDQKRALQEIEAIYRNIP
jgi:hypothetical protein